MCDLATVGNLIDEWDERRRYVAAALEYVGTPYRACAAVKGHGIDCATILICAAKDANIELGDTSLPSYSPQWHLHNDRELYLEHVQRFCVEVDFPARPGDIAVWKFYRTFSHGAIVVQWPLIVHALVGKDVRTDNVDQCTWLQFEHANKPRPVRLFSHWPR